jgi:hypothetical protein
MSEFEIMEEGFCLIDCVDVDEPRPFVPELPAVYLYVVSLHQKDSKTKNTE